MIYEHVIIDNLLNKSMMDDNDENSYICDDNPLNSRFFGYNRTNEFCDRNNWNYLLYFHTSLHTNSITSMLEELNMPSKKKIKEINPPELDYFTKNYATLKEKYLNKWIAIANNSIVGFGDSIREARSMAHKAGYEKPAITRVVPEGWEK